MGTDINEERESRRSILPAERLRGEATFFLVSPNPLSSSASPLSFDRTHFPSGPNPFLSYRPRRWKPRVA